MKQSALVLTVIQLATIISVSTASAANGQPSQPTSVSSFLSNQEGRVMVLVTEPVTAKAIFCIEGKMRDILTVSQDQKFAVADWVVPIDPDHSIYNRILLEQFGSDLHLNIQSAWMPANDRGYNIINAFFHDLTDLNFKQEMSGGVSASGSILDAGPSSNPRVYKVLVSINPVKSATGFPVSCDGVAR